MDYEDELKINENSLPDEWIKQPNLYLYYSGKLAEAQKAEREKKDEIPIIKSRVELEIRQSSPIDYGLEKFTESTIKSLVEDNEGVRKTVREWSQAKYESDVLAGVVESIKHRKSGLEYLSQFWISGIWSNLKEPKLTDTNEFKKSAKNKLNKKGE